ncbi:MAG TPA: TolC family protein [Sphingobacteriaceae bacterium]|nr:TolC family protein [Sphingobacteriaceae bacterium]
MLKRLTTLFILLAVFFTAQAQQKITLQRAVEIAVQNNLQIKQAELSEALSDEDLKQSKLALFPTLNASNSENYSIGRIFDQLSGQTINQAVTSANGSLSSSVTVFQGYQKMNQIAQNKFDLEADKSNTRKAKNDLSLSVVTTYLQVLNARDLVEASRQQLEFANQQLDREQKLLDVGNRTLADLSQAKAQVSTAELNLTNAQNQLDLAFLSLGQLMELPAGTTFEVEIPVINSVGQINNQSTAEQVYNSAMLNYPDIKVAEYRRLAAEKTLLISRGGLMPRLSLSGNLGSGYSSGRKQLIPGSTPPELEVIPFGTQLQDNYNRAIGLSLTIPIFNGYQARSAVSRAKIGLANSLIQESLAKNTLNKVINQAIYDLRAAEKRYVSTQSAYNSSNDAFNVIKQRYDVGLVNSLDYNQAQINLNRAQFDMIQAKYDLIFRNKLIDFYLGKPLTF